MVLNCCKPTTKSCNLAKLGQDYKVVRQGFPVLIKASNPRLTFKGMR